MKIVIVKEKEKAYVSYSSPTGVDDIALGVLMILDSLEFGAREKVIKCIDKYKKQSMER